MQNAIATSTRKAYNTGWACYRKFLLLNNVWVGAAGMPPVSEDLLMMFAAHCFYGLHLSYGTIKLYICGVRFNVIVSGLPTPFNDPPSLNRLQLVLKGIKRTNPGATATRLPITIEVLRALSIRLQAGLFSPYTDLMMESVCVIAFFGFLRCAEFTCASTFHPSYNLCLGDVSIHDTHVILKLKQSKADPFRKGVDIKLFCVGGRPCPTCVLTKYIGARNRTFPSSCSGLDSLYLNSLGSPLTRPDFLSLLKQTLIAAGFTDSRYTGHSFRIGAATSAASARIEDHLIKTMGRWASDSYCRYIVTPTSALSSAQVALSRVKGLSKV